MGRSYLIECPKCGYKAMVSGGEDSGFSFAVQTTACRDCRLLFDSVVRLRVADNGFRNYLNFQFARWQRLEFEKPPAFEEVLKLLPPQGIKRFKWVGYKIRCPVSLAHRVLAWSDPGKCPRCGSFMEKNALPFRHWD